MAEYIDRVDLLRQIGWADTPEGCIFDVRRMPLADVVPVIHGRWEPIINAFGELEGWMCKCCGTETKRKSNYCPNCGAKMDIKDGGDNDEAD